MAEHRQNLTLLKSGELQVYTRSDSKKPIWQARCNNFDGKGYITQSLKTQDKELAIARAEEWYDDLRYREKLGLIVHTRTVSHICDLYIKELKEEIEGGLRNPRHLRDYRPIAERYVKGFFGNTHIDNVKQRHIADFTKWCKTYWTTGPGSKEKNKVYYRDGKRIVSPTTRKIKALSDSGLGNIYHVLRNVFRIAVKYNAVREVDVPTITMPRKPQKKRGEDTNSRSAFTLEEYRKLYRFMRHWPNQARTEEQKQRRALLKEYVLILVNTGMRPGTETNNLCWKHIEYFTHTDGVEYPRMWVNGKTGERQLVGMRNVKTYFERIKAGMDKAPSPNDPVFCLPDGRHIKHDYMRSLFGRLLKACGLKTDALGHNRSLYCCRHTYATFRLVYGRVSVYTLKENMGTSVKMIEQHYGHLTPTLAASELTQRVKPV